MTFRTKLKGYDKSDVMQMLDGINAIMVQVENGGITLAEAETKLAELNPKNFKTQFNGFNPADVENWYNQMSEMIRKVLQ